jgi:hypothetical protein
VYDADGMDCFEAFEELLHEAFYMRLAEYLGALYDDSVQIGLDELGNIVNLLFVFVDTYIKQR